MGKAPAVRVSKLNAARRQLDCAIEMWFADKDEVAIHTLAAGLPPISGPALKLEFGAG